jgi:hypothetical protein
LEEAALSRKKNKNNLTQVVYFTGWHTLRVGIKPTYQKQQVISLLFREKTIYKQMNLPA